MKNEIVLVVIFFNLFSINAGENVKKAVYAKLTSNETINYTFNCVTIQGNSTKDKYSSDTLFIKTYSSASFSKVETDKVFGYHFVLTDSLIHPYFKVPQKTISYYKDSILFSSLTSPMKNSFTEKNINEMKPDYLQLILQGSFIEIISVLDNNDTKQRKDTALNTESCYHYSIRLNDLDYSLFVSKKSKLPLMMRITTSTIQPFIKEYYYTNFTFTSKLTPPDFGKAGSKSTKETALLKRDDILPEWTLHDLQNNSVSFEKSSKYKVIYLSMINCGPCQLAIPYVEKLFNHYQSSEKVSFFVVYPIDSKESLEKYVNFKKIKTQLIYNSQTDESKRIEIINQLNMGFPLVLFVDNENRIIHIENGFSDDFEVRIRKKADQLTTKN